MEILLLVLGSKAFMVAEAIFAGVGLFSAIAKLTPTKKDDVIADALLGIIDTLALNPKKKNARI